MTHLPLVPLTMKRVFLPDSLEESGDSFMQRLRSSACSIADKNSASFGKRALVALLLQAKRNTWLTHTRATSPHGARCSGPLRVLAKGSDFCIRINCQMMLASWQV